MNKLGWGGVIAALLAVGANTLQFLDYMECKPWDKTSVCSWDQVSSWWQRNFTFSRRPNDSSPEQNRYTYLYGENIANSRAITPPASPRINPKLENFMGHMHDNLDTDIPTINSWKHFRQNNRSEDSIINLLPHANHRDLDLPRLKTKKHFYNYDPGGDISHKLPLPNENYP